MDIRNFFGGSGGAAKKTALMSSSSPKSSKVSASLTEGKNTSGPPNDVSEIANAVDSGSNNNQAFLFESIPVDLRDIITWKPDEGVPYLALVDTFENISKHSGRLDKENIFTKFFRSVILASPNDLTAIAYLSSNAIAPAYEGLELGIGDSLIIKAICEATGRKRDAVEEDYKREGDLGVVALLSRASQKTLSFAAKPRPLLASFVLAELRRITETKGEQAQSRKVNIIKSIMVRCQGNEAKYIVRSLQGKLRIGTAEQTVLVGLAHAFAQSPSPTISQPDGTIASNENDLLDENEAVDEGAVESEPVEPPVDLKVASVELPFQDLVSHISEKEPQEALKLRKKSRLSKELRDELAVIVVKRAFSECPSLDILVKALLAQPLFDVHKTCRLRPGIPVAPMLAKPTKEIGEVLKRLSGLAFTMEYKYDGERAQVHLLANGDVKIFSRNSEDNTNKYPDLTDIIRRTRHEGVETCVIDAEVVAFDREKGCLLPFQILSTRKRKVDEGDEDNQKVKVVLQAFDMLFINGKSLLSESLRTRRQILHAAFKESVGYFHFASGADHVENGDTAPIEAFLQEACSSMSEGLMVKTLDSNASYEPSKRSLNWLKVKKDYIDGMGVCDSVDLVVIGGYHGRGKRTNVYGAYLMACYDPDNDEYQSVCKVGTGFKDEDLTRLTEKTKPLVIPSKKKPINYNVGDPLEPDDWFEPTIVWELQAADLSQSSVHKGAIGRVDPSGARGVGLRFPRFIRERDDKKPTGATSAEQIADLYFSQDLAEGGGGGAGRADDEDEDDGCI